MFHLILAVIGLIVAYRLAVLLFWCAAYLAIQPVRLALYLLGATFAPTPAPVRGGANVIQFPRRSNP
jgi:hypothetical protein